MARIIVAEDSRAQTALYKFMIQDMGHEAVCCTTGTETLEKFKEKAPDLFILDIGIPEIDGLELCRKIRHSQAGVSIPVIIVSSEDSESMITRGMEAGADDYILKPINANILKTKVLSLLAGRKAKADENEMEHFHTVLDERFKLINKLNESTNSVTFLAQDKESSNHFVIVKIYNEKISSAAETLKEIQERIRKVSDIKSHNIVRVIATGFFKNKFYSVSEYADGRSMQDIAGKNKISEAEAVIIAVDILNALKNMHAAGIVHMNIKPSNILVHGEQYKLADPSIEEKRNTSTMPLSAEASSLEFMPPECLNEILKPDPKNDIYRLALCLYTLVAGRNPFVADKPALTMYNIAHFTPVTLADLNIDISQEFSDTVKAMMNKNPIKRPPLPELLYLFSNIDSKIEIPVVAELSFSARKIFHFVFKSALVHNPCIIAGQRFDYTEDYSMPFNERIEKKMDWKHTLPQIIESDYGKKKLFMAQADYQDVNDMLVRYWKNGMVVSLRWFPNNPFTGGNHQDLSIVSRFEELCRAGSQARITWLHQLEKLADALAVLKAHGVPVLWAPFPQMNGGSGFWWGSQKMKMMPPEDFVKIWEMLFKYLTFDRQLNNLIWVYSPNVKTGWGNSERFYYPGREYVDLIVPEFHGGNMIDDESYKALAALGKPMGLSGISSTEFKTLNPENVKKRYPKITFVIFADNEASSTVYEYFKCPFFNIFQNGKNTRAS